MQHNIQAGDGYHRGENIFQPPKTPASATTPSGSSYLSNNARKRSRADSAGNLAARRTTLGTPIYASGTESWQSRVISPAPLANENYLLAGGFDTPTWAAAAPYVDNDDMSGVRNFRSEWGVAEPGRNGNDYFPTQGPLARERNGIGRANGIPDTCTQGWGQLALGLVGTVAGKMWDFCCNSAFRGFYAGGGQGYSFGTPFKNHDHYEPYAGASTPLPGGYVRPEDTFSGDFDQDASPIRPSKRQHTDSGSNWVMVEHPSPRLSVRKTSATNTTTLSNRPSASRASSRRSLIPVSRKPFYNSASPQQPQPQIQSQPADRRASLAPVRSPAQKTSPTSRPALRYSTANSSKIPSTPETKRQARGTKDSNRSMQKMNRQVQDLIRQGQAALGTKIEVEDGSDGGVMTDEGFESGEGGWEHLSNSGRGKW